MQNFLQQFWFYNDKNNGQLEIEQDFVKKQTSI